MYKDNLAAALAETESLKEELKRMKTKEKKTKEKGPGHLSRISGFLKETWTVWVWVSFFGILFITLIILAVRVSVKDSVNGALYKKKCETYCKTNCPNTIQTVYEELSGSIVKCRCLQSDGWCIENLYFKAKTGD